MNCESTLTAPRDSERASPDGAPTVAVSGAGGLVGSQLATALGSAGYRVLRLVRRPVADPVAEISWDPQAGHIEEERLRGVQAVINLAGRSIAEGRWTAATKREIRDSRVLGTQTIARALGRLGTPPPTLINASAIGYYGDRGTEPLDESSAGGKGFLAETTAEWETATGPAVSAGSRVVLLRIGVVFSATGGALAKMLTPLRLGIGGRLGTGRQIISWISLDDLVSAIVFALSHPKLEGPVNAVAPAPVTNNELTRTLARLLSRPAVLPLPEVAIGLLFGEMGRELLLSSAYVIPRRLERAGFTFRHATLEAALRSALRGDDES